MQFEDFDKKIKEAAENHHPAYDEQAWGKMNTLLDKHMPVKEERRRRFVWLFFLLFLVGGAGIFYGVQSLVSSKSVKADFIKTETDAVSREGAETATETESKADGSNKKIPGSVQQADPNVNVSEKGNSIQPADGLLAKPVKKEIQQSVALNPGQVVPAVGRNKKITVPASVTKQGPALITPDFQSGVAKKKKKTTGVPDAAASNPVTAIIPDNRTDLNGDNTVTSNVAPVPDPLIVPSVVNNPVDPADVTKSIKPDKNDSAAVVAPPAADPLMSKKKQTAKKQSQFYLTLSAGPDASFTNNGKPGRVIPVTGAGIGYTFRERFSVRAGFYNAEKVYTALPEAYHAPASFYSYYPFLTKVDASCRVYEIPVSLGYHFGARNNHSWFASATLSSYLMKRETYNYSYKTSAWGAVQQREWSISNRNQHLFSVLGISAGYQRKITDRISFIAEPYLRTPLNGVGYGKVKLNSAGVLFSLAVQPAAFIPRKQKK